MTIIGSKYVLPHKRNLEESLDEKHHTEYSGSIVLLYRILLHQRHEAYIFYWESFVGQIHVLKTDVAFYVNINLWRWWIFLLENEYIFYAIFRMKDNNDSVEAKF